MKKLLMAALIGTMVFSITGCKGEEKEVHDISINVNEESEEAEDSADATENKSVDAKAIADSLLSEISYTDQLSAVDLDTAKMFLNFADVEINEAYIYESSGATAEEIVVLVCKDSDSAAKAKSAFEQRVSEQKENFTDYVPEEVPKLNDAVIITSREYAILSVSGDSSKAKDIIEGAFK
ncbi:MAG: DUF4358 domain-containing protein [Lachnospiraceae bacterium]|nr:DUF4358 domain-containing protein [Lachnospiraceae bacterium]